jgi:hypothetical protein
MLEQQIEHMDQAISVAAQQNDNARLLMTQCGVVPAMV